MEKIHFCSRYFIWQEPRVLTATVTVYILYTENKELWLVLLYLLLLALLVLIV